MSEQDIQRPIGVFRHFAAMFYDWFLLIAVILVAVTAFTLPLDMIFGSDTSTTILNNPIGKTTYQLYLVFVGVIFYLWFWVHGGQTLGLKVWKMKLVRMDGQALSYQQAILRIFLAIITCMPVGIGFFWKLFNNEKLTLYDRWSQTRLIRID